MAVVEAAVIMHVVDLSSNWVPMAAVAVRAVPVVVHAGRQDPPTDMIFRTQLISLPPPAD